MGQGSEGSARFYKDPSESFCTDTGLLALHLILHHCQTDYVKMKKLHLPVSIRAHLKNMDFNF